MEPITDLRGILYNVICIAVEVEGMKEGNVLFNDALNTF